MLKIVIDTTDITSKGTNTQKKELKYKCEFINEHSTLSLQYLIIL